MLSISLAQSGIFKGIHGAGEVIRGNINASYPRNHFRFANPFHLIRMLWMELEMVSSADSEMPG